MNLLSKKITCPLWTVISIVAFISLAIGTGNITVSDSFIVATKLITVIIIGVITIVFVGKLLINYKDSIIEIIVANTTIAFSTSKDFPPLEIFIKKLVLYLLVILF